MKTVLLFLGGLLLLFALVILIARLRTARKFKIGAVNGVQWSGYLTLGKIEQYVQIRGQDVTNPIMIVLHGGPGNSMVGYSYAWQADLERAYTIVHWDQRGCANTYYRNKGAPKPTLDLLLSDLDALVDTVRSTYGKDKVFLMGHSWGTFLGAIYAGKHPEKVSAYVAVSQMLEFKRSEQVSALEAIRLASAAGNEKDAQKIREGLERLLAWQSLGRSEALALIKLRQLKERYLPPQYGNSMLVWRLFSPYMTFNDLRWMFRFDKLVEENSALYEALFSEGKLPMCCEGAHYEVPVILIAGDRDWTTPYKMAVDDFSRLSAPEKVLITLEGTGHIPFADRPKAFSEALNHALRDVA